MLILTTKRDVTSSVLHNFGAENKRFVRVAHISFCLVLSARSALGAPALLCVFGFCFVNLCCFEVFISNNIFIQRI